MTYLLEIDETPEAAALLASLNLVDGAKLKVVENQAQRNESAPKKSLSVNLGRARWAYAKNQSLAKV